jgi:hypothetical protein
VSEDISECRRLEILVNTGVGPMQFSFTAPIGVLVKGELWSCVEVPGSVELFGTGKAVRVVAQVDDQPVTAGLMPTGSGGHMLSISAKLRRKLGKNVGDDVLVHLSERLT